jgi:glycosyltransferase involved in cell wall biosynthesis
VTLPRVLHVLCDLSGGGAERLVLEIARRTAGEVAVVRDGMRVHRLGPGRAGGLVRLTRLADGFDLVHTHLWAGDLWGRLAGAFAGRPIVSTLHNTDRDAPWRRALSRATAPLADRVVAVSDAVAAWARQAGVPERQLVVIHDGVDLDRFGPWIGGERLLGVGRLVPQKGFDVLVKAARRLGVGLDIAGEGPLASSLQAPGVRLLGPVDDVPALLSRAAAVVVPSRWEGFGMVALEGMAAGVPVVASAVGGLVEVVGDAGLLVPPDDPDALAVAIGRVLSDPGLRSELSARGRARAARFSLESTVRHHRELWRSLAH